MNNNLVQLMFYFTYSTFLLVVTLVSMFFMLLHTYMHISGHTRAMFFNVKHTKAEI